MAGIDLFPWDNVGFRVSARYVARFGAGDESSGHDLLASAGLLVSFGGDEEVGEVLLDTDGDGIPDLIELANGLDPLLASDALNDADGDLRNNLDEYLDGGQINVADTGDVNGDQVVDVADLLHGNCGSLQSGLPCRRVPSPLDL